MAEDRDELLALGAAGALTPDETVELDRLLAADPQAAAEYAALVDDLTVLAESVAEPPPAGLRAADPRNGRCRGAGRYRRPLGRRRIRH